MAPLGWGLLSTGLMLVWCGMTCRNPVKAVMDALQDTPPEDRQSGCKPTGDVGPIGNGEIGRSSPLNAGPGAVATAQLAKEAGFRGVSLIQAVAIAGAESGHNDAATGDTTIQDGKWGPSIGRWQIRSLKAETNTGQWRDANRLHEPQFNAKAAYAISSGGTNWSAWSTYTNGKYRSQLNEAKDAVSQVGG